MLSFAPHVLIASTSGNEGRSKRFSGTQLEKRRFSSGKALQRARSRGLVLCDNGPKAQKGLNALADDFKPAPISAGSFQFEEVLMALQNKAKKPRQRESAELDRILSQELDHKEMKPEQILDVVLDTGDAEGDGNEDWHNAEERAFLSLVGEVDSAVPDSQGITDHESIIMAIKQLSLQDAPEDAVENTGPTLRDENLGARKKKSGASKDYSKLRINAMKRRKRLLAQEVSEAKIPTTDVGGPVADVIHDIDRRHAQTAVIASLASARIVHFERDAISPRSSALTAAANRLIGESFRCPFVCNPLMGMQCAFDNLDRPPCPRCGRPAFVYDSSDSNSLCRTCYKEIYLEEADGTQESGAMDLWEDAEVKAQRTQDERAVTEKALETTRALLQDSPGQEKQFGSVRMAAGNTQSQPTTENKVLKGTQTPGSSSQSSANGGDESPPPHERHRSGDDWRVQASTRSMRTKNPIRNLVQNMKSQPNPNKKLIKLSIGDPTVYGNLKVSSTAVDRYCEAIRSGTSNGYSLSMGSLEARTAVAKRYSTTHAPLTADDVFLTGGTSGALELAIGALANEGDNLLLPRPGFPLFVTIAENYGIECRYYRVKPDSNWEIELGDLIELTDDRTAAILVNNPSNPCGSVYSESHIQDLLATASALKLPIIADEVYADMVFSGQKFASVGSTSTDVPVMCVGGISKQFVVPGWRLGWVLIHDRNGIFEAGEVRRGIRQLTTRMLCANTPAQAVLPTLLREGTQDSAFKAVMTELETNATFTVQSLATTKGIRVIEPQGSMYVMAEVDVELLGLKDDMDFTERLMEEESVFVLPGQCFQAPNFVRIVFAAPRGVLSEAFYRIRSFCARRTGGM